MASGRVQGLFTSCSARLKSFKGSLTKDEEKNGEADDRPKTTSFLGFCRENLLIVLLFISLFFSVLIGCIVKRVSGKEYDKQVIAYISFPGTLFLNALKMVIIPLIVSSLIAGVASLDKQASGKLGWRAIVYYMSTTTIAVIIGIVMVSMVRPGKGGKDQKMDMNIRQGQSQQVQSLDAIMDLLRNMVPPNIIAACFETYKTDFIKNEACNESDKNTSFSECYNPKGEFKDKTNVLGLVVFSCLFGAIIGRMGERGEPIKNFIIALMEATMKMVGIIIWFTPVGVFFLLLGKILSMNDWAATIAQLGLFSLTVMLGLAVHAFIVLPLLFFAFTRKNPFKFFMGVSPALMTAFATASSSATLPVTLASLEQNRYLRVDRRVTRFVLPIGATINMDGTALYEAVAAIFIAQLNDEADFKLVIVISIIATLASIGAAGVPQAGIVTLVVVLNAVGLPVDDIPLIIAIDWFLDRCRTTINVWGDSVGAGIIYMRSKEDLKNLPDPFANEDIRNDVNMVKIDMAKTDKDHGNDIHMVVMVEDEDAVALEKTEEGAVAMETVDKDADVVEKTEEDYVAMDKIVKDVTEKTDEDTVPLDKTGEDATCDDSVAKNDNIKNDEAVTIDDVIPKEEDLNSKE